MPYRHGVRAMVRGAVLACGTLVAAVQALAQAPAEWMVVTDSAQALVQAVVLPAQDSKARGIPLQVQIELRDGASLQLPGAERAASAMVLLQVRCPSGVWAIEKLLTYAGAQGSGAIQVVGAAPPGQLTWQRLAGHSHPNAPGLLWVWMEMVATKVCR